MHSNLNFFDENSLLTLLIKGGWVMIPLTILSIVAVHLIVERIIALRSSQVHLSLEKLESINRKLIEGDYDMVYSLCNTSNVPMTNIIKAGVEKFTSPHRDFESAIENTAQAEIRKIEKNIGLLANVASLAPLLGFFGTIIGMIEAFIAISTTNVVVTPSVISVGIYEALITTAAGLFIAIISTVGYNFASNKVNKLTVFIERYSNDLVELLKSLRESDSFKKN